MKFTQLLTKPGTALHALVRVLSARSRRAPPPQPSSFNSPPSLQAPVPSPTSAAAKISASPPASTSQFSTFVASDLPPRFAEPIPSTSGTISSQKNFLLGPKDRVPHRTPPSLRRLPHRSRRHRLPQRRIHLRQLQVPQLQHPGPTPPASASTTTSLISLAVKVDFQYQHWDTPAVASGSISPKAMTLGAVYIFDFNPRHHHSQ